MSDYVPVETQMRYGWQPCAGQTEAAEGAGYESLAGNCGTF